MHNLKSKKIFVTGGSRGIGSSIVKFLDSCGADVAFTFSSNEQKALELKNSLNGTDHLCFKLDVSQSEQVDQVIQNIIEKWGKIDAVINNAGITKDQLILRMKNEDFQQVMNTNMNGAFYVTRAVCKYMLKSRSGSIVNISSVIGSTGNQGQSNYAASKGALEAFTRSIALEFASRGIRANCVAPGYIKSDMTDSLTEDQLKKISEKIPMHRPGEQMEVAQVVAFLLSDSASYITGQTIHVNGGMYLS
jgi:3-oxoacyl-[acyl-carrier protein] reductase